MANLTDQRVSATNSFDYARYASANWVIICGIMQSGATQQKIHDALGRLIRVEANEANAAGQRSQLTLLDGGFRGQTHSSPRSLSLWCSISPRVDTDEGGKEIAEELFGSELRLPAAANKFEL